MRQQELCDKERRTQWLNPHTTNFLFFPSVQTLQMLACHAAVQALGCGPWAPLQDK